MWSKVTALLTVVWLAIFCVANEAAAMEITLTNASQVRALTSAQAQAHSPVRLKGIVISEAQSDGDGIVLLDETAGIFVSGPASLIQQIHRGDSVELEGTCDPGEFAPILLLTSYRQIGRKSVPAPVRATYEQIISGSLDAQWVEVEGVVRSSEPQAWGVRRWKFDLAIGGGRLAVVVITTNSPAHFVDAGVRVRGICFYQVNQNRQVIQPEIFVPHEILVKEEQAAPRNPFAMPVRPIGGLLQFTPDSSYGHRQHVHGIVTACQPGKQMWLQDESGGVRAFIRQTDALVPGDEVDLLGFPTRGSYSPVLEDAVFQKADAGMPPEPICLKTAGDALEKDAWLVRLEANLVDVQSSWDGYVLQLTEGGAAFKAVLVETNPPAKNLRRWEAGSRVRLTGICSVEASFYNSPVSGISRPAAFQILLRSVDDVLVIQAAPWLNRQREIWLLSGTSLGLIVVVVLVVLLARRRLREQALQRELAEAELTAILKERNRMAREIHDTLAQGLGAISMRLELLKGSLQEEAPGAEEHLEQARKLVRTSLAEARNAIWNMRAQVLEQGDLATALAGVLDQLTSGTPVACQFHQSGPARRLAPLMENDLLRIGQEAITNAIHHGKPKMVMVELEFGPRSVKLRVSDDGIGYDTAHPPRSAGGFGLVDMRERVEQLGGEMNLHSSPGQGSEVSVELPIAGQAS